MQHLNYCRQLRKAAEELASSKAASAELKREALGTISVCSQAQKFLLPPNGRLLHDSELRALDGMELNLPHPHIAIEFPADDGTVDKTIIFCHQKGDEILMKSAHWGEATGREWLVSQVFGVPRKDYFDRASGRIMVSGFLVDGRAAAHESAAVSILLGLLNALACSNVKAELSQAPGVKGKMLKAIPFDAYHVLVLGGSRSEAGDGARTGAPGRSPREHLRRGHIRRLPTGARIWVNASVVNAGVGGRVEKDYKVQK